MKYFPPKSFIKWANKDSYVSRMGQFKIVPCNNKYNDELYCCFSVMKDNKYQTKALNNGQLVFESPWLSSEEEVVSWLEDKFIELATSKVNESNKKLRAKIEKNRDFLKYLSKAKGNK